MQPPAEKPETFKQFQSPRGYDTLPLTKIVARHFTVTNRQDGMATAFEQIIAELESDWNVALTGSDAVTREQLCHRVLGHFELKGWQTLWIELAGIRSSADAQERLNRAAGTLGATQNFGAALSDAMGESWGGFSVERALAAMSRKNLLVVFNNFSEIYDLPDSRSVEGALRSKIQSMPSVFLFSGDGRIKIQFSHHERAFAQGALIVHI